MVTSYIGADVDSRMTELAVERNQKIICRDRIPTDIASIRSFLEDVSGPKVLILEESTLSGWLYRNLKDQVNHLIVCDPRRNKAIYVDGDKTDALDAAALAALYRGGYIREVYHTDDPDRQHLKEIVALYHDRVKEAVRQINKLRSRCYGHGLRIPSRALTDAVFRQQWLGELNLPALAHQLTILWIGFDANLEQVKRARKEIARLSRRYAIAGYWRELPGVGLIRAATLLAYLDTPFRFKTSRQLWKYCGLGLRRMASGTDKRGQPRPGYLQLHRGCNHLLKSVIVGATLSAIRQRKNIFYHYCPVTS
jgi:transposase